MNAIESICCLPFGESVFDHVFKEICIQNTTGALIFRNQRDFFRVFFPQVSQIVVQSYPFEVNFRKELMGLAIRESRQYSEITDVIGPVAVFRNVDDDVKWQPDARTSSSYEVTINCHTVLMHSPTTTLSVIQFHDVSDPGSEAVFQYSVSLRREYRWEIPNVLHVPGPSKTLTNCQSALLGTANFVFDNWNHAAVILMQGLPSDRLVQVAYRPKRDVLINRELWQELSNNGPREKS